MSNSNKIKWQEGESKYARKFRYLHRRTPNGIVRVKFGFEVPEPKPWKK